MLILWLDFNRPHTVFIVSQTRFMVTMGLEIVRPLSEQNKMVT